MKRILITGASGFVGRHCLPFLVERGFEVYAVSAQRQIENVGAVIWKKVDLLAPGQVESLMDEVRPSHVLHLAWIATPGVYLESPLNLDWATASLNLVRSFAARGGRRFVASGSCLEYDSRYGYCCEDFTPVAPTTLYGACKHGWHVMLEQFAKQAELSAAWGRIFHLYGPHENRRRLVPAMVVPLLKGEAARCTPGTQIRDFMHVEDVARALVALVDSELTGTVNIGSGRPISVRQIVTEIAGILSATERVQFGALPAAPGECPLLVADARRLNTQLGFLPTFNLVDGLRQTIEWWKSSREG